MPADINSVFYDQMGFDLKLIAPNARYTMSLTLALLDSAKNDELIARLTQNSSFIYNGFEYSFSVKISNLEVKHNDSKITVPAFQISLEVYNSAKVLDHVFETLYKFGYGLELHNQYILRNALNLGTERHYLERSETFIAALKEQGDNLITKEYQSLLKLCNEFAEHHRPSLVYKIAKSLQFNGLYQCARGLISLYNSFAMFGTLDAELSQRVCSLNELDLVNLRKSSPVIMPNKIMLTKTDPSGEKIVIQFAGGTQADLSELFDVINNIKDRDHVMHNIYLDVYPGVSDFNINGVFYNVVFLEFKKVDAYLVLEYLFMSLCKAAIVFEIKSQYSIRKGAELNNIDDYINFAQTPINLLKSDDPTSFEYNWLVRMSHELPGSLASTFVMKVALMLKEKNFINCALCLTTFYRNDRVCQQLPRLVNELESIHYILTVAFFTIHPQNESIEDKNKRLESYIRVIFRYNAKNFQNIAENMFCELANVAHGTQEVIKHLDHKNLDASFRFCDQLRYTQNLNNQRLVFSMQAMNVNDTREQERTVDNSVEENQSAASLANSPKNANRN